MKRRLIHTAIAVVTMILCAFIPPLWQGVSDRDFRPQATTMAVFILLLAIVFRRAFRWQFLDFILGLVAVEFLTLWIIAHFSGFTGLELFHRFNLSWLALMSIFAGLPWLAGFGLGSLWLRFSHRHAKNA
jgi:hypothetical protein